MENGNISESRADAAVDVDRTWVAPEFTVLNAGATAGGPRPCNVEFDGVGYHPLS
jgi:hypothetical protein